MRMGLIVRVAFVAMLFAAIGCTSTVVTSLPPTVRRVVVFPPYRLGGAETRSTATESELFGLPSRTIEDLLAQQARAQLTAKGFDVVETSIVKQSTKDRVPTSPQMAAQILQDAKLDAAALYIEVRRWEPMPSERGLKADGVIVALDVMIVDPKTGAILWQVNRPSRPVPLYGVVLTGQANVFVAETVMKEVFTQLGSRQPGG